MRLPFVFYQAGRGHDVGVGLGIGRAGRIAAMLWIVAVGILWPQSVHHKAQVSPALRAVPAGGAELRRPGEVKQVEIELPRRRLLLRASAARPAPACPLVVAGVIRAVSWLVFASAWTSLGVAMGGNGWLGGVLATDRCKQQQEAKARQCGRSGCVRDVDAASLVHDLRLQSR